MILADTSVVLDREQLRSVTLDDEELKQEILQTLIEDTARQLRALDAAIRAADGSQLARLAHYSKGACANVGAVSAAATLHNIERKANSGDFAACGASLTVLAEELQKLRHEAGSP